MPKRDDRPAVAVLTRGMQDIATLPVLLDEHRLVFGCRAARDATAVLAWGRKPSAAIAGRFAERLGLPLVQVEDGFLRSVSLGDRDPPLSLVVDDLGIYYDATVPSRLEVLVAGTHDEAAIQRAERVRRRWCDGRVSKYNHARDVQRLLADDYVLVVDQTFGDSSIGFGLAEARSFARMLQAALDEHPGARVLLKVHPDVVAGRKRGHFAALEPAAAARVHVLSTDGHPPALLERAIAVYTVTSQVGFEALLWDKQVRCFGMPFYAGWGLTQDELPAPKRRRVDRRVTLPQLVDAALVQYPRYFDPDTQQRCGVEQLVDHLALQRRMRQRFAPRVHALGFSRWKKPIVRAFFGGSDVQFVSRPQQVPPNATIAVWGRREAPAQASSVVRLEDGFLRSVGLGADLVRPLSWVMDSSGMYYDATQSCDLERLLRETRFDGKLIERAKRLRERIAVEGITKYNVGQGRWRRPADARRVVLVPGQVESDAAITYGAPGLRSNMGLLQAVRRAAPDAWVVYKPHPDVVARLRREGVGEDEAREHCDEIVVDVPMHVMLDAVDEVHVMTSLAGFEALLRGRRVATYGQPFYAGWGLTDDHAPPARRGRLLTLDELVAGVLLLYPTYVSRRSGHFTTAERALDELLAWRSAGGSQAGWVLRLKRALLRWLATSPIGRF